MFYPRFCCYWPKNGTLCEQRKDFEQLQISDRFVLLLYLAYLAMVQCTNAKNCTHHVSVSTFPIFSAFSSNVGIIGANWVISFQILTIKETPFVKGLSLIASKSFWWGFKASKFFIVISMHSTQVSGVSVNMWKDTHKKHYLLKVWKRRNGIA